MRLIDADALKAIRFHDLPYSQIVPADCDTDEKVYAYKLGWNDAIDAIVESVPTVAPVNHGHWIEANDVSSSPFDAMKRCLCSECREWGVVTNYCPNCGAKMDETPNIPRHNGKSMMELERLMDEVTE